MNSYLMPVVGVGLLLYCYMRTQSQIRVYTAYRPVVVLIGYQDVFKLTTHTAAN